MSADGWERLEVVSGNLMTALRRSVDTRGRSTEHISEESADAEIYFPYPSICHTHDHVVCKDTPLRIARLDDAHPVSQALSTVLRLS